MHILNSMDLEVAIGDMRRAGTDLTAYEVKTASSELPRDLPATISAFANLNGGSIILGISEKAGFHPVDDFDARAAQAKIAQSARDLVSPPVVPDIRILEFEGKPVVIANIPEFAPKLKPCFVKKLGQINGSFIRTGDGDHHMSLYEIDRFVENQQRTARNDVALIPDSSLSDLDDVLLASWLAQARLASFGRTEHLSDEELIINRRIAALDESGVTRLTLAGLMAMGKWPQSFLPRANVVFTHYPETRKGDLSQSGNRFIDSANIEGNIPEMLASTIRAVSRNIKHGAIVKGALREDVPDYPLPAIREAVANALMHRDYSIEGQCSPILVDLFPDRLEITNPGGLYGSLTIEKLGTKGGTISRNQFLARILEDVPYRDYDGTTGHVVENRGSGFPTINNELERALMGKPLVTSSLDEFSIILRHRKMTQEEGINYSKKNVEEAILDFLRKRGSASTSEIANASGVSTKTARLYITALVEDGLVDGIGSKHSPKRKYRLNIDR